MNRPQANKGQAEVLQLKALGDTIRLRRQKAGLSQEAAALESGLDRSYVGGVERGERNISWINLVKLARGLRLTVSQLVEGADK